MDDHQHGYVSTRDGEAPPYSADDIKVGMIGIIVPLSILVALQNVDG